MKHPKLWEAIEWVAALFCAGLVVGLFVVLLWAASNEDHSAKKRKQDLAWIERVCPQGKQARVYYQNMEKLTGRRDRESLLVVTLATAYCQPVRSGQVGLSGEKK